MKNQSRDMVMKKLVKFLEQEAETITTSKEIPVDDKVSQLDLVLNTVKFLGDYDKNIEILNKYYYDNRYKQYHTEKGEKKDESQQH